MTRQRLIDLNVAAFLVADLPFSVLTTPQKNSCAYAGPNGTGCAIGITMSRAHAEHLDTIDTASIHWLMNGLSEAVEKSLTEEQEKAILALRSVMHGMDVLFLSALQSAHDSAALSGSRDYRMFRMRGSTQDKGMFTANRKSFDSEIPYGWVEIHGTPKDRFRQAIQMICDKFDLVMPNADDLDPMLLLTTDNAQPQEA